MIHTDNLESSLPPPCRPPPPSRRPRETSIRSRWRRLFLCILLPILLWPMTRNLCSDTHAIRFFLSAPRLLSPRSSLRLVYPAILLPFDEFECRSRVRIKQPALPPSLPCVSYKFPLKEEPPITDSRLSQLLTLPMTLFVSRRLAPAFGGPANCVAGLSSSSSPLCNSNTLRFPVILPRFNYPVSRSQAEVYERGKGSPVAASKQAETSVSPGSGSFPPTV